MSGETTRSNIVSAADRLFYEQGYEYTSFADVAKAVGISRGNFYHHFKTKDQILDAVIERRLSDRQAMLQEWDAIGATPHQRIECFIRILFRNQAKIRAYGCPLGSLSLELAKLGHKGEAGARRLFDLFRFWLGQQFELIGYTDDADELAMHILARSQGVATLANVYPEEDFLEREADGMLTWLHEISAAKNRKPKRKRS